MTTTSASARTAAPLVLGALFNTSTPYHRKGTDMTSDEYAQISAEQEHARKVARDLLTIVAGAFRHDAGLDLDDDRLLLAEAFEAAVPLVGDPVARPVVLPLAKLAQRMYAAGVADGNR